MPDNGFGTIENSADFLLRLYRLKPDWETASDGAVEIFVNDSSRSVTRTMRSAFRSSTRTRLSGC